MRGKTEEALERFFLLLDSGVLFSGINFNSRENKNKNKTKKTTK